MHGPVFGQEQVGAVGGRGAVSSVNVHRGGDQTQGLDRDGAGLPGQDAGTTLLSIADKRRRYRKIRSRSNPVQISFKSRSNLVQLIENHY